MRRRLLFALALTVALVAAPALAQEGGDGPRIIRHHATTEAVGPANVTIFADPAAPDADETGRNLTAGGAGALWVNVGLNAAADANATYNVTVRVAAPQGVTLEGDGVRETGNISGNDTAAQTLMFDYAVAEEVAEGDATFTVDVHVARFVPGEPATNETNATAAHWTPVADGAVTHTVRLQPAPLPPPEEEPPWLVIGAAGAVVVVGGGAAAYAVYKRRQVPQVQPRSRALQETRMEREKPAVREEVRQEAARQAQQKAKSRELQILEAKRDDLRRSIDLARKRVEAGELTEHQFQRIKEKKEDALEGVLREIDEKRGELQ